MIRLLNLPVTVALDAIVTPTDYVNTPVGGLIAGALIGAVAVLTYLISRHIHGKKNK
jgi:hypothetical protein